MRRSKTIQILLVEDNPDDIEIAKRLLAKGPVAHELRVVRDGQEAIEFLSQGPRPGLVLLDLKLPKKSGHEVLCEIREHPALKDIPVVVLTVSNAEMDFYKTLRGGVDDYLLKHQLTSATLAQSVRLAVGEKMKIR